MYRFIAWKYLAAQNLNILQLLQEWLIPVFYASSPHSQVDHTHKTHKDRGLLNLEEKACDWDTDTVGKYKWIERDLSSRSSSKKAKGNFF